MKPKDNGLANLHDRKREERGFCGVINFEHCQDIIKDILTAPAIHTRIFVFDLPNSGYM